jgi:hypothetical protein
VCNPETWAIDDSEGEDMVHSRRVIYGEARKLDKNHKYDIDGG